MDRFRLWKQGTRTIRKELMWLLLITMVLTLAAVGALVGIGLFRLQGILSKENAEYAERQASTFNEERVEAERSYYGTVGTLILNMLEHSMDDAEWGLGNIAKGGAIDYSGADPEGIIFWEEGKLEQDGAYYKFDDSFADDTASDTAKAGIAAIRERFAAALDSLSETELVYFVSSDGLVVKAARSEAELEGDDGDLRQSEWYAKAFGSSDPVWTADQDPTEGSLCAAESVYDKDNELIGVAAVKISKEGLFNSIISGDAGDLENEEAEEDTDEAGDSAAEGTAAAQADEEAGAAAAGDAAPDASEVRRADEETGTSAESGAAVEGADGSQAGEGKAGQEQTESDAAGEASETQQADEETGGDAYDAGTVLALVSDKKELIYSTGAASYEKLFGDADVIEEAAWYSDMGIFDTSESTVYLKRFSGDGGWCFCLSVSEKLFDEIVNARAAEAEEQIEEARGEILSIFKKYLLLGAAIAALLVIVAAVASSVIAERFTLSIRSLATQVKRMGSGDFEGKVEVLARNEIGQLAEDFNGMQDELKHYMDNLQAVTAEKERTETELAVAAQIQQDMLPQSFPAFPEEKNIDIYASMTPAKEVGGDFYDFYRIDKRHIALVIGDVSGKGMPAALFMAISRVLIKMQALSGGSPAEILAEANERLCGENSDEMFVTVWLGIVDTETGEVTAANAGHEYPIIRDAAGKYSLMKDRHGFVLGGMEGMRYKDYSFRLEPGGALVVYTDGVAEANNEAGELFGTERMLGALNSNECGTAKEMVESLKEAAEAFAQGAPQFDDMTLMALKFDGRE